MPPDRRAASSRLDERAAAPVPPDPVPAGSPGLKGEDVAASLGLLGKLLTGLDRIVDGQSQAVDEKLVVKGGVIDAFATLAGIQIKLIQLHRERQDAAAARDDPVEFAARLRAAQREMEALTRGTPDVAMDRPAVPPNPVGIPD